ncbi:MAG: flavodoxin family protein [Staphylococcus sp.]|nr:flavodoxin family protein [Staphylococcus sp.]
MEIIIINSSPRKNGNTAQMCMAFQKGVITTAPNSKITAVFLNDLEFKGCQSCFACKLKCSDRYGKCSLKDDLTPILDMVNTADCIVLASPIYLMDVNSCAKAFLERLCFSLGSYETGYRSLAKKKAAVVTIFTMNTQEKYAPSRAMDNVDMFLGHIFSSPQRLCAYNTYQFSDYSKYRVEVFDEAEKSKYREAVFTEDLQKAHVLGSEIASFLLESKH